MSGAKRPSMNIHVTASAAFLNEDIEYLRTIVNAIHEQEHVVALNWIEPAYLRIKRNPDEDTMDWQSALEENSEAIARSDLVIVEATRYGFGQGYQVALALQQKKPVLLVSRDSSINDRLVAGISDKLFVLKIYKDKEELEKIVTKFIQDNVLTSKDLRFNFFIDNEIYNHLRWTSFKTGKTRAEIIRELVQKEIDKESF